MDNNVTLYDIIEYVEFYNKKFDANMHLCFCANAEHNKIEREWSELND